MNRGSSAVHHAKAAVAGLAMSVMAPAFAWEPVNPVILAVAGRTGGGAHATALAIQSVVAAQALTTQPVVVQPLAGGAGAEAFLQVKGARGDAHQLLVAQTNVFTTPLSTGVPFHWKDLTPLRLMALEKFVLWVNADSPYRSVREYLAAAGSRPQKFRMGGAGLRQDEEILTAAIETASGSRFDYIALRDKAEVPRQLAMHVFESSLSSPADAAAEWRAGRIRPLCVLDSKRISHRRKVAQEMAWSDIPSCKEEGLDVEYVVLRGVFMAGAVAESARDYYSGLLEKVARSPQWVRFAEDNGLETTPMTHTEYVDWLSRNEERYASFVKNAGLIARR
jgi:tripartite-type tricarboxylate transporter receptor subunit TctC